VRQYVKQQGSYWLKTNENTGWWIEIEGGYYTTISNGSTSQLVPKFFIIDYIHQQNQQEKQNQQEQKQNYYHQYQQNQQNQKHQELQELQQQELQEQEFQEQEFQQQQNQQIDGSGNSFTRNELERVNELERNEPQRERKSKCEKCGLEGSYVKRKVKSHYYLYIRHQTNGKIKECLISRLA
jgi:flagellar biosynthesis GTPase FlhF